mmetsp:Transcript_6650/g.18613  ORF Transcript_6650/g.18613 Transcript_6650/m.18613 type:complete len:350 (-) Transcript_6650:2874-3923(-)
MSPTTSSDLALPIAAAAASIIVASAYLWNQSSSGCKKKEPAKVQELFLYPLKSGAEIALQTATPTLSGFEHDRRFQLVDVNGKYCTTRNPDMVALFHVFVQVDGSTFTFTKKNSSLEPLVIDTEAANTTTVLVDVMETKEKKRCLDYGDAAAAWFEKTTNIPNCRLVGVGPEFDRHSAVNPDQNEPLPYNDASQMAMSLADEAPYLLCNQSSLDELNRRLQERDRPPVDMRRFRPNIVVTNVEPFEEDSWKTIQINETIFHVWQRCGRCNMTTIDRDTLERKGSKGEPLSTLSTFRERSGGMRNFGMHLIPDPKSRLSMADCAVSCNDTVQVLEYNEERRNEWKTLHAS